MSTMRRDRIAMGILLALCLAIAQPSVAAAEERGKQQASDAKLGVDKKKGKPVGAAPAAGMEKQKPKSQVPAGEPKGASGKPNAKPQPVLPTKLRYLVPFQKLSLDGEISGRSWTIYLTQAQAAAARTLNYGYRSAIFVAPETSKMFAVDPEGT